ncbi:MAG TPA: glycosyltransferase family 9 protein [Puia sp.]|nr:glycosyltransferase family 9 protein [Puia sp.]
MQKFLVIQTAFIGDVVLATGIIEKLHEYYPDAQIDFLVRKGNEALLAAHPFLHEVLVWDKKQHKLSNLWNMGRRIRQARYDKVINVQRFAATGLLTAFSGAGETIGFDKNPLSRFFSKRIPHIVSYSVDPGSGHVTGSSELTPSPAAASVTPGHPIPRHEIERNQELIRDFTDARPARPRLYPSPQDIDRVGEYKRTPYITVSPASVWFTKQYPKEKWISFINKVPASYTVYLLGAPSDNALCEEIRTASSHPSVRNLSGQLSFLQSAALMADSAMNYVNDSAPMHFASSVNAPVTAVYCSTIPSFGFGPLSDKKFIVEITEPLDCRPCGLHGYKACPKGHFNCAWKIEDTQLLQTL